ncbi:MAG: hypothetical protein Q9207_001933 [Kuettlingeria erythrocarpa]
MAIIKAIEGRTVHQIQSGQVIVDLCSVVKELLENSLDAGATSIALKHYTSKLSTYDDLSSLRTFGFRGEALSSLCALSNFHIVTAQADEAPKGIRLEFETSGKLKGTSVVATQKGTTVTVEGLFANLPVRRRDLEKNIKREYGKILGLLQAYACISTSVKFSVSNVMAKGKKAVVFATQSNPTSRENIANVFGAKTLPALVQMDLSFGMQASRSTSTGADGSRDSQVRVSGHVSKPVLGEGRQAPDRQMFFVNGRPCSLPQFAKVFNEVYKSYNLSQSPFVFANIILDTDAYDVNVSPDKRTILLHDQAALLESLRGSLTELFEKQDQTVPQTQRPQQKLPSFKQLTVQRQDSISTDKRSPEHDIEQVEPSPESAEESQDEASSEATQPSLLQTPALIGQFAGRDAQPRAAAKEGLGKRTSLLSTGKRGLIRKLGNSARRLSEDNEEEDTPSDTEPVEEHADAPLNPFTEFNKRIAEQEGHAQYYHSSYPEASDHEDAADGEVDVPSLERSPAKPALGAVENAFDRMRPRRKSPQVATITIGSKTRTALLGSTPSRLEPRISSPPRRSYLGRGHDKASDTLFSGTMQAFRAPGTVLSCAEIATPALTLSQEGSLASASATCAPPGAGSPSDLETDSGGSQGEALLREDQKVNEDAEEESDDQYLDDEGRKAMEDAKVADLIHRAEEKAAVPNEDNLQRAGEILQGRRLKDSTTQLLQSLHTTISSIEEQLLIFERDLHDSLQQSLHNEQPIQFGGLDAEQKLSLTVSKVDFGRMEIVGQFNLGFILAIRPSISVSTDDELFIIDQHASDEKFNFERLQASTIVQNQRLVRPKALDLTAIEEEIILENNTALVQNGFLVEVDQSGDSPVGHRCRLMSLPVSREVTFDLSDLEELVALLGESPPASMSSEDGKHNTRHIPRPSKVRKLFAMRACRSSVMIGKSLQKKQMENMVKHMGEIDKPWNCPHGRPTMRHVIGLRDWEGWREGDGLMGMAEDEEEAIDWKGWLSERRGEGWKEVRGDPKVEREPEGVDDSAAEVSEGERLGSDGEDGADAHGGLGYGEDFEESSNEEARGTRTQQSICQRFLYS